MHKVLIRVRKVVTCVRKVEKRVRKVMKRVQVRREYVGILIDGAILNNVFSAFAKLLYLVEATIEKI